MKKQITYKQAYDELENLINEIESDSVQIDALSDKVKRANDLITYCREKLRNLEAETNQHLSNHKI